MRFGSALALSLAVAALNASCGSDTEPPPPCEQKCCLSSGVATQRCGSCELGEVAVPLDRCTAGNPDAGPTMTCGNGRLDPSTEQCDPSASAGCPATMNCSSCMCVPNQVDVCGDGMVTGGESCERNADCTQSTDLVCRRCQCELKNMRVTFTDTVGDVPATPRGYGIDSLGLELDGGNDEFIVFGVTELGGIQPDMLSNVCVVIVISAGHEQRLCLRRTPGMGRDVTFTDDGVALRALSELEAPISTIAGVGYGVRVQTAVGVRFEPGLSFYVVSDYNGMQTDILPDTGVISFKEIFGE